MDVLEPLAPFIDHSLYPRAKSAVIRTKRESGFNAALHHAYNIADAMTDATLLAKLRQERLHGGKAME